VEIAITELGKAAGPVLGSLIVLLILTVLTLSAYVKTLINHGVVIQDVYQNKLNKVYEERVQEAKGASVAITENSAQLIQLGRVMELRSQGIERMILILDKVSNDVVNTNTSRREYTVRIENLIRENKELGREIERQVNGLERQIHGVNKEVTRLNECCKQLKNEIVNNASA